MIRSEHCKFLRGEFAKNEKSTARDYKIASATRHLSENEAGLGKCVPVVSLPR
jgi:hypothetical protein